jgi:hypothetical protein
VVKSGLDPEPVVRWPESVDIGKDGFVRHLHYVHLAHYPNSVRKEG